MAGEIYWVDSMICQLADQLEQCVIPSTYILVVLSITLTHHIYDTHLQYIVVKNFHTRKRWDLAHHYDDPPICPKIYRLLTTLTNHEAQVRAEPVNKPSSKLNR
jgi:hypothetical protein